MPILIGLWLFFVLSGFALSAKAENVGHDITAARVNDKGEYLNTAGELSKGGVGTRLPFMLRRFGTYFRDGSDAPPRVVNDGQWLRDNSSEASVTWVGHATFLVQMHGITFLTDPIWSDVPSPVSMVGPRRFVRPGILIEDLPRIDFVLISHNHYDHLDLPTLQTLAQRNAETWAVTGPHKRFYHAGDTGYFPGFKNIGAHLGTVDLAAMPIGAYAPRDMMQASHMNPEEAVQAAVDLGAKNMVGMHFGTFDLSDEPLDEPPKRFRRAAAQQGLNEESVWVMKVGETRLF